MGFEGGVFSGIFTMRRESVGGWYVAHVVMLMKENLEKHKRIGSKNN